MNARTAIPSRSATRLPASLLALLLVASAFLTRAGAQSTCAPQVLCDATAACPPPACGAGVIQQQTVSVSLAPAQPPFSGVTLAVPRFTALPGQVLLMAEVVVEAELANSSIQARSLTSQPVGNQQFQMASVVQFAGNFPPFQSQGAVLLPQSPVYTASFGATTWPGPPANPCDFSNPQDTFVQANISNLDGKRACITDPALLSAVFTGSPGQTVDFACVGLDNSTHTGGGSMCIVFLNFTKLTARITYSYCQPASIVSVTPASGPLEGGTPVTAVTTGLQPGLSAQVELGGFTTSGTVTGTAATQSVSFLTLLANASGSANLTITQGSSVAFLPGAFSFDPARVTNYCTAKLTSQGLLPHISFIGSPSLSVNNFELTLSNALPNKTAQYVYGLSANNFPIWGGTLCIGTSIVRGPVVTTNASGRAIVPFVTTPVLVGSTRYFQYWFRDPQDPAGFGYGLSEGLKVEFYP